MVAEVLGQRADVDAVREQRAGESVPSAWNPFSRHGVTPAACSAGCQVFRFQSPRQIAPPAGAVNASATVTFWPPGACQGNPTPRAGCSARCADSRSATDSGSGTSRSLPPFGGANRGLPPTILT